jgi:putative phosphoesterase
MKIGVVADIHGNEVALSAVLDDMPPVETIVCAGDVVGYNPWHGACVDAVRERGMPTIMGNHDRAVIGEENVHFNSMAGAGVQHARETLGEEQLEWLRTLPEERVEFDGRVKIVHGHPDDPDHYTYPAEYTAGLLDDEDVLIMGHTHVQTHSVYDEGIVMNPGSVGQPRDGDARAAYAVLDLQDMSVAEHRVEYDVDAVVEAVEEAGLPTQIGARLKMGT